jgi:hypothetical protein
MGKRTIWERGCEKHTREVKLCAWEIIVAYYKRSFESVEEIFNRSSISSSINNNSKNSSIDLAYCPAFPCPPITPTCYFSLFIEQQSFIGIIQHLHVSEQYLTEKSGGWPA